MKKKIALFLTFFLCLPVNAVQGNLSFIPLSLNEGLTHTRVQCIFRDHSGVLWIGTKNGLNSWDQSELKQYLHHSSNPHSLPDNNIRFIARGSDKQLYLATTHGVGTFDPVHDEFTPLLHNGKMFEAWSCLHNDSLLLLGGRDAVYSYNYHHQSLTPLVPAIKGEPNKCINHIARWDSHTYLASSKRDGIWMYDLEKQTMQRCPFVKERNINNIFVDSSGCLYVSVYGNGVFRYRHDGTLHRHFTTRNKTLSHDVVFDFVEKDSVIWMGTDGGGINLLDLRTDQVKCIRHTPGDLYSLPNNSIYCLYKDEKENIWGGSIHSGLFSIIKSQISNYKDTPLNQPNGLSELTVTALHEDADTLLWIGTDGGGINNYNPRTGLFRHFPSTSPKKVVSIVPFSADMLLTSCFNDGLYLFDKRTSRLTPFPFMDSHTTQSEFTKGDLVNLYATSDEVWIFGYNIYVYNPRTHLVRQLSQPEQIDRDQLINANPIHADGQYLYALSYKSLLRIEKSTKTITTLFSVSGNESLTSACADSYGNFWIGSDYALYHYNTASLQGEKIRDVLLHNIQSMASDSRGRIWIGANNMLFAYLINERRTVIMDETDGAKPNGYIFTPMPASASNNIYMGGTQGLTVIDRDIELSEQGVPTVDLLSFSLDGKDVTDIAMQHRRLTVPYQHSSISFKVIVDEELPFRKHLFDYTLKGDQSRVIQSDSRKVELGTLKPGNYTLLASCSTNSNWNETAKLLEIHIQAPIWQRTWFVALCILAFVGVCIGGIWVLQKRMGRKLKLALAKSERDQIDKVRFITRLNDVIDNNIDKPDLDNQFLQNEMGMGRSTLYNKLKQTTGMGTSEYINHRKIEKAESLLLNTNLSISEISDRLGFSYQRYFSTLFKRIKGMSPSQFRQQKPL